MASLVSSNTNATSNRWHLWEIDSRFALNSTPGWARALKEAAKSRLILVTFADRSAKRSLEELEGCPTFKKTPTPGTLP